PAPRLATGRLLPLASRRVGRQLLAVLDQLALSRGFAGWIEKTPRHLRYLPFLERLSERTHFVHVLRDGVDTVASLLAASRSWPQRYDLATCIQRWNRDVAFSLSRLRRPNDHFVFYEDLTRQPEATLEPLLGALGLEWEEGLAERYGQGAERLIADGERWKAGVGDGVRPAASSAGSGLSPQQLETAQRGLRHELYTRLRERAA
ncbi:MAG: sulfotransferase, partial [Acidobacteriota bacterium]